VFYGRVRWWNRPGATLRRWLVRLALRDRMQCALLRPDIWHRFPPTNRPRRFPAIRRRCDTLWATSVATLRR